MVVHSPKGFAVRRGDGAEEVPPSVMAAAQAQQPVAPQPTAPATGDLLGGTPALDLAAWDDQRSPAVETQADVHATGGEQEHVNVTVRKTSQLTLTNKPEDVADAAVSGAAGGAPAGAGARLDDADRISLAGSVSDVTAPPNVGDLPTLNPFTPEWFAQIIGAAATTAATAAASAVANAPRPTAPSATAAPTPPSAPRRLNDRKVPDF